MPTTNIFNMSSSLNFDKFKGDDTQNPENWLKSFQQYCDFYDLIDPKRTDSFPFHWDGHAKIWYDTIPEATKKDFGLLTTAFKDRFKDKNDILDLGFVTNTPGQK